MYHSGLPINGGFTGVDIFFVVSGFVIATNLLSEISRNKKINFALFYWNRFYRIFPALSLMISCTIIISSFVISPILGHQNLAKNAIASIFGFGNLMILHTTGGYFDLPSETNPLLNVWSLSVEEQFYIFLPLCIFLLYRIQIRVRREFVFMFGFLLFSSLSFLVMVRTPNDFMSGLFGFYSPLARAWEFGLGVIAALIQSRRYRFNPFMINSMSWIGFFGLLLTPLTIHTSSEFPDFWVLLPTLSTFLLILFGENAKTNLILSIKPLQSIGRLSYSVYLWHWPFIVYAMYLFPLDSRFKFLFAIGSIIPAVISYKYVEKPFRSDSCKRNRKNVFVIICTPLFLASLLFVTSKNGFWNQNIVNFQQSISQVHAGRERGCFSDISLSSLDIEKCSWNASSKGKRIYLVGDSNAEQFAEAVIRAGTRSDNSVVITGASACPFIGGYLAFPNLSTDWNNRCREFNSGNITFLKSAPPSIIVIGNIDSYFYTASNGFFGVGIDSNNIELDFPERNLMFKRVFKETISEIQSFGHQVVLIQTIPNWVQSNWWEPYWCTTVEVAVGGCKAEMPASVANSRQGEIRKIMLAISLELGLELVDTWDRLCSNKLCSTESNSKNVYRDGSHISVQMSQSFETEFFEVFTRLQK
jgi:peptidoglycan/LPS O-acetylase OafA/YrhL